MCIYTRTVRRQSEVKISFFLVTDTELIFLVSSPVKPLIIYTYNQILSQIMKCYEDFQRCKMGHEGAVYQSGYVKA